MSAEHKYTTHIYKCISIVVKAVTDTIHSHSPLHYHHNHISDPNPYPDLKPTNSRNEDPTKCPPDSQGLKLMDTETEVHTHTHTHIYVSDACLSRHLQHWKQVPPCLLSCVCVCVRVHVLMRGNWVSCQICLTSDSPVLPPLRSRWSALAARLLRPCHKNFTWSDDRGGITAAVSKAWPALSLMAVKYARDFQG